MTQFRLWVCLFLPIFVLVGCGGGGSGDGAGGGESNPPASVGDSVEAATVRVTATVNRTTPTGSLTGSSQGSGFFVDDTHIVTNNHVVSGASTISVDIKGKGIPEGMEEEVIVKLLGVAECDDLAVLELTATPKRQITSLQWGTPERGMDVISGGFPIDGDDAYRMADGSVGGDELDHHTSWASTKAISISGNMITNGNSGGPLVESAGGTVVGVTYAKKTRLAYAVSGTHAKGLVERMMKKENIYSIGISGEVVDKGVWVYSVQSGRQADLIGIKAGDTITKLAGGSLSADSTMKTYCKILKSNNPNNPDDPDDKGASIAVEILRNGKFCTGTINGTGKLVKKGTTTPCGEQPGSGNTVETSAALFKIPDTGQTTSYTDTHGEDSDYTINPPSYTNNGNGTVTDNVTGLMWQRKDDDSTYNWYQAAGVAHATYNPDGAADVCGSLSLGGYSDWRLPTVQELPTILDLGRFSPAIDTVNFPGTNSSNFPGTNSSYYWSATTYVDDPSRAWDVSFRIGFVLNSNKTDADYVRCVRGGQ